MFIDKVSEIRDELIEAAKVIRQFSFIYMNVRPFGVMVIQQDFLPGYLVYTDQSPLQPVLVPFCLCNLMH